MKFAEKLINFPEKLASDFVPASLAGRIGVGMAAFFLKIKNRRIWVGESEN